MATMEMEGRVLELERRAQHAEARLARLEDRPPPPRPAGRPSFAPPAAPSRPRPAVAAPTRPSTRTRPAVDLEDLLGGRVLAWAGGLAVTLGIAFLLAMAVSQGWVGETARVVLAGLGSLVLLAVGVRLHERHGRTEAAMAAAAAGIAGLFATVAVGGPGYHVLPVAGALAVALATGLVATWLAVRWEARGIGALGVCGALLAPVLAGAPSEESTLAVLWIAAGAGAGVVVWRRWAWLGAAVFGLALPQWLSWVVADADPTAGLAALIAFGALNAALAVGYELRVPATRLRPSSALLLTANAVVLAVAGAAVLGEADARWPVHAWLTALAALHAGLGLGLAATRVSRDLRLLGLALATILADVALALMIDGVALAGAWAAGAAAFGALARHVLRNGPVCEHDEGLLALGLGAHVLLGAVQALVQAPPDSLTVGGSLALGGHAAVACAAIAAFVAARFTTQVRPQWRRALDTAALAGLAYQTALSVDGPLLVIALAAEGVLLAALAHRHRDPVAGIGAPAFVAGALLHALCVEAPPGALLGGLADPGSAALALTGVIGATLWIARTARAAGPGLDARVAPGLAGGGAVLALYLASVQLVTALGGGDHSATEQLLDVGPDQLAQAALSALWAVCGLATLVTGLLRDSRALRLGALALLSTTVVKVFGFDLATLGSIYRVCSFVALGVLLLLAAFAWQRVRPRPPEDLRAAPAALR